jgi:methylated-DNA-protein-cysteine methyltransferase related protein
MKARSQGPNQETTPVARTTGSATTAARRDRVTALVRAIPEGFVRTYGDIDPSAPRVVGHILAQNWADADDHRESDIPWHRVVRADGSAPIGTRQLELLRREGVAMRATGLTSPAPGWVRIPVPRDRREPAGRSRWATVPVCEPGERTSGVEGDCISRLGTSL